MQRTPTSTQKKEYQVFEEKIVAFFIVLKYEGLSASFFFMYLFSLYGSLRVTSLVSGIFTWSWPEFLRIKLEDMWNHLAYFLAESKHPINDESKYEAVLDWVVVEGKDLSFPFSSFIHQDH